MIILVETPDTRGAERDYISGVILGTFLDLPWRRLPTAREDTRIRLSGHEGEIILPDLLFQTPASRWLTPESLPTTPLSMWRPSGLSLSGYSGDDEVPIIYGVRSEGIARKNAKSIFLPIDLFGSAFFMFTRYEEIGSAERDEHERFPASASLAYRQGFLERPVIDEYVEILWSAIRTLWPWLRRKRREFKVRLSHDVDHPSKYLFCSAHQLLQRTAGDTLKRRDFRNGFLGLGLRLGLTPRRSIHPRDPYNTFGRMMDIAEGNGLKSAFYFLCGRTNVERDADYDPGHPAIRDLMRQMHDRGHEIGLHPSYDTYRNPEALAAEACRLRKICTDEGIQQDAWGGRMHYLRWETPATLYCWEQAEMTYDCTLGYADHAGFRCGTCHEYQAFDPVERKRVEIRIRPLIAMDQTIICDKYMALGSTEAALNRLRALREACENVAGDFTLLWHNTRLQTEAEWWMFQSIL